jgi:hypothetical protein
MEDHSGGTRPEAETSVETLFQVLAVNYLRRDCFAATFPVIRLYLASSQTAGRVNPQSRSYTIFAVISNEIRNSLDHVMRASTRAEYSDIVADFEMARWHLHLCQISALIPVLTDLQSATNDAFQYIRFKRIGRLTNDQNNEKEVLDDLVSVINSNIETHVRPSGNIPLSELDPPATDRMIKTQEIATSMVDAVVRYAKLVDELWAAYSLKNLKEIRRELHIAARRRALVAVGISTLTFCLIGIQGAYGNFLYALIKRVAAYLCRCSLPSWM